MIIILVALLLSALVVAESGPKFVVLTYNRLASLKRLLASLEKVEPKGETIDLRVCIDKPAGKSDEASVKATVDFVKEYNWPRGKKEMFQHATNVGVVGQWLRCWEPKSLAETAILLEDDIEVSAQAYRWVVYEQHRYKAANDVAGFSLQRQTNCFHSSCKSPTLAPPEGTLEYKYKLVGTWGFSPNTKRWQEFQEWFKKSSADPKYIPNVDRILPSQWYKNDKAMGKTNSMWSIWFLDFCEKKTLYTVYYNDPRGETLAGNWKERGVHFGEPGKTTDFPLLVHDFGRETTEINLVLTLEWNALPRPPPSFDSMIVKTVESISHRAEIPLISFVNLSFFSMVMHFLCNLQQVSPDLLQNLILVATDHAMYEKLSKLSLAWNFKVLEFLSTSPEAEMVFFTKIYNVMILNRTIALLKIMDIGFPFMMVECDAVVRNRFVDDFVDTAITTDADAVGIAEHPDVNKKWPNGGFILFTGKKIVRQTWKLIVDKFRANLNKFADKKPGDIIDVEHEQTIFGNLVADEASQFKMVTMDPTKFMSGKSFQLQSMSKYYQTANVVLFNFVVGLKAKIDRAKKHNMWYIDDSDAPKCVVVKSTAVTVGEASALVRMKPLCEVEQFASSPQWPLCWNMIPRTRAPRVWSFGVGDNINFELAFLKRFPDADVCSFDPTISFSKFAALCENEDRCPSFRKLGLGPKSGVVEFYKSDNPKERNLSLVKRPGFSLATKAEVKTLPDLMSFLGVNHVDVLKLDLEGTEVGIFTDIKDLDVSQLTFQFHDSSAPDKQPERDRITKELTALGFEHRFLAVSKMVSLFTKSSFIPE
jgi:FkbM family methyltransferase